MNADPLSREAALERVKAAGIGAGKFGAPADANPYRNKGSFHEEAAAWESGRQIGAAARKAGAR